MKKIISKILICSFLLALVTGCSNSNDVVETQIEQIEQTQEIQETQIKDGVTLNVITSYGVDDANHENYLKYVQEFENETGHTIIESSGVANEQWKDDVVNQFRYSEPPDVLFFFTGADADILIQQEQVVSLDTIRKEYPNYGTNMKEVLLPNASYDNKKYAIPVNGYWEALYVNKKLLQDVGIDIPGYDYTFEQFLLDCDTLKNAGITPISASLGTTPHYWFEFMIFNQGDSSNHTDLPEFIDDDTSVKWINGINEIKNLYDSGFFPDNTLDMTETDSVNLFCDGEAAFLVDGSWRIRTIMDTPQNPDDFIVTLFPHQNYGGGDRTNSDIIGGLSMGYFITTSAWEDESKRDACIEFVNKMTSNEVVSTFGSTSVTALKTGAVPPEATTPLEQSAIDMTRNAVSITPAVQDGFSLAPRLELFAQISNVLRGDINSTQAVNIAIELAQLDAITSATLSTD